MSIEKNEYCVIALTKKGIRLGKIISDSLDCDLFIPDKFANGYSGKVYGNLEDAFTYCFKRYGKIIAVMAMGIVYRKISGLIESKYSDPAVVVCDEVGRFAISALSGHEGGANELAYLVASIIGAEPVITTATEANKCYVAGIGCRKGTKKESILEALNSACDIVGITPRDIRVIASIWAKKEERGLIEAAKEIGCYTVFLRKELYENDLYNFKETAALKYFGVKGVAEPSALLAARNPELILKKQTFGNVTVAIVRERLVNG